MLFDQSDPTRCGNQVLDRTMFRNDIFSVQIPLHQGYDELQLNRSTSMVRKPGAQEGTLEMDLRPGAKVQAGTSAGANRSESVAGLASRVAERAAETNDEVPSIASAMSAAPKIKLRM